jgi:hypothetical protein
MVGGFLGLCAGIGIAFLIEFFHPVFHTREDVQQFLGLPVIATLPREQLGELNKASTKAGRRALLLIASLILITLIGFTLWYFKVHRHAEHIENQATKPKVSLSNLEKARKNKVQLARSDHMALVRQAQASSIQLIHRKKIPAPPQEAGNKRVLNSLLSKLEFNSESVYAKIEQPKVKLLKNEKGFIFSFKLTNPIPTTPDKDPISGNVAIVTALKSPHTPPFISFPSMELDQDGLPVRLTKSLSFRIRNFRVVSAEFGFPFSLAEFFRILIYNADDQLVGKYTVRPEEITKS